MKQSYIYFLLVTSVCFAQLTPPTELQSYYSNVDFSLSGTPLYNNLATETIAKHTTFLAYTDRHDYLYDADEDLSNPSNVILIYSGESRYWEEYLSGNNSYMPQTFNTEHVYPQSLIGSTAEGDLHHLRSCDISINSSRANKPFANGSGSYSDLGSSWYPGDEWKGDVARMIMYLNLRYAEPFDEVGSLSLFLQWNVEDPVSPFEDHRNKVISAAQGNRNPFIDNPYLATVIWGGTLAENRWNTLSTNDFTDSDFKIYPNPTSENYFNIKTNQSLKVEIFDILGKSILKTQVDSNNSKIDINRLTKGIYLVKLISDKGSVTKKLIKQ
ncbi:endonuclease [Gaetbulibacter sp. M235]|uniref:endonuclease n=1 Tax=Gaetbulibacter sp. M235 TaxID=3126510 RepID=UPI00374E3AD1